MDNLGLLENASYNLTSIEHCRLSKEWNYKNIISPFTRLYLITKGNAYILLKDQKINLREGYLYLIPSYKLCSYHCDDFMEQFYTTFTIHLPENLSIYQLYNFNIEIKASAFHYELFKRLHNANPDRELPNGNPLIYQKTNLNTLRNRKHNAKESLTTYGLLSLLLADFIDSPKIKLTSETSNKISASLMFIHRNINHNITVANLASQCSMSPDYFTRKFKELTKQNPIDYINRQRIEKALLLLNSSAESCKEIGFQCGFNSNTYFCKTFKIHTGQSPNKYRANLNK